MEATLYTDGTYLRNHPGWHAGDAAWKATHVLRMLERNRLSLHTSSSTELAKGGWKTHLLNGPRRGLFAMNPDAAVRRLGGSSLLVLSQ